MISLVSMVISYKEDKETGNNTNKTDWTKFSIDPDFSALSNMFDDNYDNLYDVKQSSMTLSYKISTQVPYNQIKTSVVNTISSNRLYLLTQSSNGSQYYRKKKTHHKQNTFQLYTKSVALIHELHSKNHEQYKNIFICEHMKAFGDFLSKLNDTNMPDAMNIVLEITFPDGHMQAIKLERKNKVNYFVIMDSTGKKEYNKTSIDMINRYTPNSNIKYSSTLRQADKFTGVRLAHERFFPFVEKIDSQTAQTIWPRPSPSQASAT